MANKPNNPALWSRAKSMAKQKFDVYPSAYANGWAAKWYKSKGGTWRKAEYGMEIPMMMMADGGMPDNPGFRALPPSVQQKIMENMAAGGEKMPAEIARARFAAAGNLDKLEDYGYAFGGYIPEMAYGGAQQAAIAIAMKKAGKKPKSMQKGGEPDGAMAIGQINAAMDKLEKLRQFIQPDTDLEPWVSSKLTMLDHYTDAVSDYMMYNPEAQGEMMEEPEGLPMPEMKNGGGIPERYRKMGFSKVGVKKESTRPGKKWMVLAKKGDQYKVVHGGYDGMKDFSQHGSEQRKENFWNRMGGKNSAKAKDPFSPLYWHKRLGTWEDGGDVELPKYQTEGWVGRAANADLKWWERCGLGRKCDDDGGSYGRTPREPKYKDNFDYYIKNAYPEDVKAWKKTRPDGIDKDMWLVLNSQAKMVSNMFTNPHFWGDKTDPATGRLNTMYLGDDWKGKVNIPSSYRFYNEIFKDHKGKVSPEMIMQYFQQTPGGLETFRQALNADYVVPKQKKGGSTFSGNAWYAMGGGVPCYECGGMFAYGGYLPEQMYKQGGPVVGAEMDVTPEELEMLKAQGYKFEII